MKPYETLATTQEFELRRFSPIINPYAFKWHFDEEDRYVISMYKTDWLFQFDNELPQYIPTENDLDDYCLFIPKLTWHRIIPGDKVLFLKIYASSSGPL
jgi:hypothetical protein